MHDLPFQVIADSWTETRPAFCPQCFAAMITSRLSVWQLLPLFCFHLLAAMLNGLESCFLPRPVFLFPFFPFFFLCSVWSECVITLPLLPCLFFSFSLYLCVFMPKGDHSLLALCHVFLSFSFHSIFSSFFFTYILHVPVLLFALFCNDDSFLSVIISVSFMPFCSFIQSSQYLFLVSFVYI